MKNLTKNSLLGRKTPKLNDYQAWLQEKNFTLESIKKYLATIIQYGKRSLNTVSISAFLHDCLNKYQPETIRSKRNALASYSKFLKKHVSIDWERVSKIIPSAQKKPFPTIDYQELEKLKAFNPKTKPSTNERDNLILDFLFYTGLRITELINIRHSDYLNGLLRVNGKGNKVRYVLLPEFLIKHFNPYSKNYLFLTRNGKQLTKGQIRRKMNKKSKLASIKKNISPHTFRRSFATNLYNLGGKLETIQKQLGHTHLNTTLGYIHNDYATLYADYSKLWMMTSKAC